MGKVFSETTSIYINIISYVVPSFLSGERSAVLPSYTINVREAHEKLVNIIDIQFLHGYYEPTLVFLSEPLKTWPG